MSIRRRVFLDMDGVIVNCNRSAARVYGVGYPEAGVLGYDWVTRTYNELHPESPVAGEDFGRIVATDPTFWNTLEWFPWADGLVEFLEQHAPGQWNFLTKCTQYPECPAGKFNQLLERYGPEVTRRAIFMFGPKHVVCQPGDILIDDCDQNCDDWERAGGLVFRWREVGVLHPEANQQLPQCLQFLQANMNV